MLEQEGLRTEFLDISDVSYISVAWYVPVASGKSFQEVLYLLLCIV